MKDRAYAWFLIGMLIGIIIGAVAVFLNVLVIRAVS